MLKKKVEECTFYEDKEYRADETVMGEWCLTFCPERRGENYWTDPIGYFPTLKACNDKIKELRDKRKRTSK